MPHYGFNFQWMFIWEPGMQPKEPDFKALDFMAEHGFNFARVTTDYRYWTALGPNGPDYFHPDERVFGYLDRYLQACRERNIHFSLNQHRAPGYCINRNDLETHNLWLDPEAQEAFIFLWQTFARRYADVPAESLSFDLVNEPPSPGQYGMTRDNHAALVRRVTAAIRAVSPERPVVIDGLGGGHQAMPELCDLGLPGPRAIHSGRGYMPMAISHYKAPWWEGSQALPEPYYPDLAWDGITWNWESLRKFYQPWRDVQSLGVSVHIGECGCYIQTPNDVAMRWLTDLFGLYREFGWGFSLWEFDHEFGIIGHNRPGAVFEDYHGYKVDRALLDLILASRVD